MSLLLLNKTLFRKTSFTEKVQISVNAICSCNIFLLMRKKWCLQKVYQFCPGYLKQTVSILYCWTIVSYPSRYNVWRLNCPFQIHAETSTGRPRKNFLSEFAQNAQICPELPRNAQNTQNCQRIAQKCPKCPELPRFVFWYVLLKKFWKKLFSGTPCM